MKGNEIFARSFTINWENSGWLQLIDRQMMKTIVRFSAAQKRWSGKALYLLKGLLFAPFLIRTLGGKRMRDESVSASSQAGDDIYPLF